MRDIFIDLDPVRNEIRTFFGQESYFLVFMISNEIRHYPPRNVYKAVNISIQNYSSLALKSIIDSQVRVLRYTFHSVLLRTKIAYKENGNGNLLTEGEAGYYVYIIARAD